MEVHTPAIVFYAFDLLHLDGTDLTGQPLLKRRARLARVLAGSGLLPSQELPGTAAAMSPPRGRA